MPFALKKLHSANSINSSPSTLFTRKESHSSIPAAASTLSVAPEKEVQPPRWSSPSNTERGPRKEIESLYLQNSTPKGMLNSFQRSLLQSNIESAAKSPNITRVKTPLSQKKIKFVYKTSYGLKVHATDQNLSSANPTCLVERDSRIDGGRDDKDDDHFHSRASSFRKFSTPPSSCDPKRIQDNSLRLHSVETDIVHDQSSLAPGIRIRSSLIYDTTLR